MSDDRRQGSTIRRQINEYGWPDLGKGICLWIIYRNVDTITNHWDALFVMLLFIIAPKMIEKFIGMRWGGSGGYTERTERHDSSVTVVPAKPPDHPPPKEAQT